MLELGSLQGNWALKSILDSSNQFLTIRTGLLAKAKEELDFSRAGFTIEKFPKSLSERDLKIFRDFYWLKISFR